MGIHVFAFQPFESRAGVDTVIGLRFRFDWTLADLLKTALRSARLLSSRKNVGGWLDREKAWFVERFAWPHVRRHLEEAGCVLDIEPDAEASPGEDDRRPQPEANHTPPVDWSAVVTEWCCD
jgi:hypothetical protein